MPWLSLQARIDVGVGVEVDETGRDDQTGRVDDARGLARGWGDVRTDLGDLVAVDAQIRGERRCPETVDDRATGDPPLHQTPPPRVPSPCETCRPAFRTRSVTSATSAGVTMWVG
jgi:hypothetical protein